MPLSSLVRGMNGHLFYFLKGSLYLKGCQRNLSIWKLLNSSLISRPKNTRRKWIEAIYSFRWWSCPSPVITPTIHLITLLISKSAGMHIIQNMDVSCKSNAYVLTLHKTTFGEGHGFWLGPPEICSGSWGFLVNIAGPFSPFTAAFPFLCLAELEGSFQKKWSHSRSLSSAHTPIIGLGKTKGEDA